MRYWPSQFIETHLSRYLDGQLGPDESALVEKERKANADLRKMLDSLRLASERLQEASTEMDSHEEVTQRLSRFVKALPQTAQAQRRESREPIWDWFIAAPHSFRLAGLALVFVLLAVIYIPDYDSIQRVVSRQAPALLTKGQLRAELGETPAVQRRPQAASRGDRLGRREARRGYGLDDDGDGDEDEDEDESGIRLDLSDFSVGVGTRFELTELPAGGGARGEAANAEAVNSVAEGRKIVREVQMAVEVEELPKARSAVEELVEETGGLVAEYRSHERERNPSAHYRLWIPAAALDGFLNSTESLGKTLDLESRIHDISEVYFDDVTRIKNLQRQEERLQKLYEREVKKLDELLQVEQKLGQIRLEIERLQGRQRIRDRQIQYSTVELTLRQEPEEERIVESEPDDVFSPIRRTVKDSVAILLYSCSLLTTLVARVISFALFVLPWAVIAVVAIWLWRRRSRW